jgi:hypothetical protein
MKINKWLTISNKGQARITASKPRLSQNEIAMNLNIEIPDALFQRPRLIASITVPDEAAVTDVIQSIVFDNVQEVIEQATGLEFAISVSNPSQDEG